MVSADSVLMERAQRGDREAQERVLDAVAPMLVSLVRRLCPASEREDVVQELVAHLLAVLPRFEPAGPAKFSTWAYTVVMRQLLMKRRRPPALLVALDGGLAVPDPRPGPDERLDTAQRHAQLEHAVQQLPDEQRLVFVGVQLQQQSLETVAHALDLPLGTVKSRLHRAKAQLVILLNAPGSQTEVPLARR